MHQVSPPHSHISATLLACQPKTRQKLSTKEPADECLGDITRENETSFPYSFLVKYAISYLSQVAGEERLAPQDKHFFHIIKYPGKELFSQQIIQLSLATERLAACLSTRILKAGITV